MDIATYMCGACTTASIANLGLHTDAHSAMISFCQSQLVPVSTKYGGSSDKMKTLEAFYVFTAGPEEPGHGHSKKWVRYGTEFAEYIDKHGLGPVATPGRILNTKYHPNTYCQTWVWRPDQEAMEKWWGEQPESKPIPVVKPEPAKIGGVAGYFPGHWDEAQGIAGGHYRCKHCDKAYVKGERVWNELGIWWCEQLGRAREKGIISEKQLREFINMVDGKGKRPAKPKVGDICPRCGEDWAMHNGWKCQDGGVWPE